MHSQCSTIVAALWQKKVVYDCEADGKKTKVSGCETSTRIQENDFKMVSLLPLPQSDVQLCLLVFAHGCVAITVDGLVLGVGSVNISGSGNNRLQSDAR